MTMIIVLLTLSTTHTIIPKSKANSESRFGVRQRKVIVWVETEMQHKN